MESLVKEIGSDKKRIINILDCNPNLIHSVHEQKNAVIIHTGKGYVEIMKFNESDFEEVLFKIKEEIKTRPNPEDRVEHWECKDFDNIYSFDVELDLLESRKDIPAKKKNKVNHRALKQLCEANNVPEYMGELYLSELRLSNAPQDDKARNQAKLLGLMEF